MERDRKAYRRRYEVTAMIAALKEIHGDEPEIVRQLDQLLIASTARGEGFFDPDGVIKQVEAIHRRGKKKPRQLGLPGFWGKGK